MHSRLRLMAWQSEIIARERSNDDSTFDDRSGHVTKWEGREAQHRDESARFPPWRPQFIQELRTFVRAQRRQR
jgi:hypothetical protein